MGKNKIRYDYNDLYNGGLMIYQSFQLGFEQKGPNNKKT